MAVSIEKLLKKNINILSLSSPYAFNLLIRIFVQLSEDVGTMGVRVNHGLFDLRYSEEFVRPLKVSMRSFVLVHECLHILLHHCTDYRRPANPDSARIDNIAMDLAVNSLINCDNILLERPKKFDPATGQFGEEIGMFPEKFGYPAYLSYEEYRDRMNEDIKSGKLSIEVLRVLLEKNGFDEHDEFTDDASADSRAKAFFEHCDRNHMWGKMSLEALNQIKIAQSRQIPWSQYLRFYAGRLIAWDKQPTRRRWHKMFGKPFLGEEYKTNSPIGCYLDVSGSMDDEDKSLFLGEMRRLTEYCPIYLWTFDAEVENPEEFRTLTEKDFMGVTLGLAGGGGTRFQPIADHAVAHNIRSIVILTDGYAAPIGVLPPGFNVLWIITKGGKHNPTNPGQMVHMK